MPTPDDTPVQALTAPYTGRNGVLNRGNSALVSRWMRDHWGKPANIAQSLAAITRADNALTFERVQRTHEEQREKRAKERTRKRRSA